MYVCASGCMFVLRLFLFVCDMYIHGYVCTYVLLRMCMFVLRLLLLKFTLYKFANLEKIPIVFLIKHLMQT